MRVIAGKYKGRKLNPPADHAIRPTSDKTKEALFSILAPWLEDARVLDLFAGSGALGIEALSRGAAECVFGDSSRAAAALIRDNLDHCRVEEKIQIRSGDYRKVLSLLEGQFDIILLDPPYRKGLMEDAVRLICENGLLAEDGVLVCEHGKDVDLPEEWFTLKREKERRYGISKLSIYRCYTPNDMVL